MRQASNHPAPLPPPGNARVIEFTPKNRSRQHEDEIEARLRKLTSLVADLNDSGFGILLGEEAETRDAFDELRIKEAALRWIVRVARHSSGDIREKLWADIEDAVAGLEKTAALLMHATFTGTHDAVAAPSSQLYRRAGRSRAYSH